MEKSGTQPPEKKPTDWFFGFTRETLEKLGPKKAALAIIRSAGNTERTVSAVLPNVFPGSSEREIREAIQYSVGVDMGAMEEEK